MTEKTPRLEFTLLHDVDPLRIEAAPGTSSRLVVSFTSVGNKRDEWPPKEFVGMSSRSGCNHVMCVSDISRCWMNADGMANKVATAISDYVLEHQINDIVAIGVSMGAYNALVLGRQIPFNSILAFTPQYSVHPDVVPEEKRWWWFRKQITHWPNRSIDKLPTSGTIYMFHGDTKDEQWHWRRMPSAENLKHYVFAGADHNFVGKLKGANTLRKIIMAGFNDRVGRMNLVVKRAGGLRRADYEEYAGAMAYFEERPKTKRPTGLS